MPGRSRERTFVHAHDRHSLRSYGLVAGGGDGAQRGEWRGVLADAKFRRPTGAHGGVHAGLSGGSLVREGTHLLCVEGELETELKDGRKVTLKPGMSYQLADEAEPHRSFTKDGAKLFIVD
jgi:hypothetical protein